jgi:hypothetical protein
MSCTFRNRNRALDSEMGRSMHQGFYFEATETTCSVVPHCMTMNAPAMWQVAR